MSDTGIDNTLNNYDNVGNGKPSLMRAQHRQVIAGLTTATRQLLASESGALISLDASDQITITLPTPVIGMTFDFVTTVSVTSSDTHKIITKTIASEFLTGGCDSSSTAVAEGGDTFVADGTADVAITSNGSTTGGLKGQNFRLTAISSTLWAVSGCMMGTGTLATPFAES